MAATLGATLSDIKFPLRHTNLGPFKSSGASFYAVVQDTTLLGQVRCVKASDPMTAFTSPAANKTMSSTSSTAIEAMAAYQVADVIHIATQIATGAVYYNSFNMATDAWTLGTSELAVAAATQPPTTGATFVDLVVRASGEVVFVYCAGRRR